MKKLNLSYFGVILSEAVRRSRRLSLVFSLLSLVLLTACTDYVSQIEDRYGEWNGVQDTEPVEVDPYVIIKSSSSSTEVTEPVEVNTGSITDSRDGQSYKTVVVGSQIWMAENLNYETANSYCYNNNASNCTKYGRLYTWAAAMDSVGSWSANGKGCGYGKTCSPTYPVRGVCPEGWHLPSYDEWNALFTTVGGSSTAGTKLKSTSGWYSSGNGTDAYSFSALPAGGRYIDGNYGNEGDYANFWSSTEYLSYDAYRMILYYSDGSADLLYDYKGNGFSVRCLKD
jgi:uncharacterized protein (TIGR02145 family)